jgi:hypothetical protein
MASVAAAISVSFCARNKIFASAKIGCCPDIDAGIEFIGNQSNGFHPGAHSIRLNFRWNYLKLAQDSRAPIIIAEHKICLPLGELDDAPSLIHIMRAAWENGMIPILSERLPHSDEIKTVCDNLLDLPSNAESAASAAKELWVKFLTACQTTPQASLSGFSKDIAALTAKCGNENKLHVRIYLLRFQAGGKEIIHPAVVLVA